MQLYRALKVLVVIAGTICLIAMPVGAETRGPDSHADDAPEAVRVALHESAEQEFFLYVPPTLSATSVILVDVHGISRNVDDHIAAFMPYADEYGFILIAPIFTPEVFDDYQRLGRAGRGYPADLALVDMIGEVRDQYGISDPKILLFGYSGGGQFAHRFAMAYPELVSRVVIGAAGWYTMPTPSQAYPYGTAPTNALKRIRFDPDEFLDVPMLVLVGDQDITRSKSLNRSVRVDAGQGRTRLERAQNWVKAMNLAAVARNMVSQVAIEVLPGGTHSFTQNMRDAGMGKRLLSFFFANDHASLPKRDQRQIQTRETGT